MEQTVKEGTTMQENLNPEIKQSTTYYLPILILLPKPSSVVTPPPFDTVQPSTVSVQSSLQDTVKSTTANSCMSRSELSHT
ncbi:hypothetical protein ACTXT7_017579, partial [Hymenolepis weldensis]